VETTRPTTHDAPTFEVDGIVHYCVANMPGAVALTSTIALASTTLPYGLKIADLGLERALKENADLRQGLNVYAGKVTFPGVASAFGLAYASPEALL
jgi:alanine dehydrogenase